jgi:hypothetical protein
MLKSSSSRLCHSSIYTNINCRTHHSSSCNVSNLQEPRQQVFGRQRYGAGNRAVALTEEGGHTKLGKDNVFGFVVYIK